MMTFSNDDREPIMRKVSGVCDPCMRNILKLDRNIYKGAKFEFLIFCRSHRVLSDAKGAMRK